MVSSPFSVLVGLLGIMTIWCYLFGCGPRTRETILLALVGTVVIVAAVVYWPTLVAMVSA